MLGGSRASSAWPCEALAYRRESARPAGEVARTLATPSPWASAVCPLRSADPVGWPTFPQNHCFCGNSPSRYSRHEATKSRVSRDSIIDAGLIEPSEGRRLEPSTRTKYPGIQKRERASTLGLCPGVQPRIDQISGLSFQVAKPPSVPNTPKAHAQDQRSLGSPTGGSPA